MPELTDDKKKWAAHQLAEEAMSGEEAADAALRGEGPAPSEPYLASVGHALGGIGKAVPAAVKAGVQAGQEVGVFPGAAQAAPAPPPAPTGASGPAGAGLTGLASTILGASQPSSAAIPETPPPVRAVPPKVRKKVQPAVAPEQPPADVGTPPVPPGAAGGAQAPPEPPSAVQAYLDARRQGASDLEAAQAATRARAPLANLAAALTRGGAQMVGQPEPRERLAEIRAEQYQPLTEYAEREAARNEAGKQGLLLHQLQAIDTEAKRQRDILDPSHPVNQALGAQYNALARMVPGAQQLPPGTINASNFEMATKGLEKTIDLIRSGKKEEAQAELDRLHGGLFKAETAKAYAEAAAAKTKGEKQKDIPPAEDEKIGSAINAIPSGEKIRAAHHRGEMGLEYNRIINAEIPTFASGSNPRARENPGLIEHEKKGLPGVIVPNKSADQYFNSRQEANRQNAYGTLDALEQSGHNVAGRRGQLADAEGQAAKAAGAKTAKVRDPRTGMVHVIPTSQVADAVRGGGRVVGY